MPATRVAPVSGPLTPGASVRRRSPDLAAARFWSTDGRYAPLMRSVILAASRSSRVERLIETAPFTRDVVRRFVAGTTTDDALRATHELVASGLAVTLDYLGEDTVTPEQANAVRDEYLTLLSVLAGADLTPAAEVSVKLSALGQKFDEKLAYDNVRAICAAAAAAGTTVTLDMEDHTTTDSTLDILARLRKDFPSTGAVLQAYLRRTEADCRELATAGSRVRLCKGAYKEPESVAYQSARDVDKSYVRCLNILLSGAGYPMLATHDPRLIAIGAGPGPLVRPVTGRVRVPDALRHPAGGADPAGRRGPHGPDLPARTAATGTAT